YDDDGNVTGVLDRDGRWRQMAYDDEGRLLTEMWKDANGTVTDTRNFTYNEDGQLLTASNSAGSYSFTYDDAGFLTGETQPFGVSRTFTNDQDGNATLVLDSF